MRKFMLAALLAVTVLGGVSISAAEAQYRRRGAIFYPRTTYYSQPYYNNFSNVLPATVYSPGYINSSFYNSPVVTVPYTSGYYSAPYYNNTYYNRMPRYGYGRIGWRR